MPTAGCLRWLAQRACASSACLPVIRRRLLLQPIAVRASELPARDAWDHAQHRATANHLSTREAQSCYSTLRRLTWRPARISSNPASVRALTTASSSSDKEGAATGKDNSADNEKSPSQDSTTASAQSTSSVDDGSAKVTFNPSGVFNLWSAASADADEQNSVGSSGRSRKSTSEEWSDEMHAGAYRTATPWASDESPAGGEEDANDTDTSTKATSANADRSNPSSSSADDGRGDGGADETLVDAADAARSNTEGDEQPTGRETLSDTEASSDAAPTSSSESTGAQEAAAASSTAPPSSSNGGCPWDDSGVGLVRHRVAQWYVPGLEREVKKPNADSSKHKSTASTVTAAVADAVAAALTGTSSKHTDIGTPSTAQSEAGAGVSAEAAAVVVETTSRKPADVPVPPKPSSAPQLASSEAKPQSPPHAPEAKDASSASTAEPVEGNDSRRPPAQRDQASSSAGSSSEQRRSTHAAKEASPAAEGEEEEDEEQLPKALLTEQARRNKKLKRVLMATLGSDFAKAGLINDGVRTSFSVVNYQTIKQLTGLKRIPSKLLMSCMVAPDNRFDWIDVSMHPTATLSEYKDALEEVLLGLGMHRTMVEDSAEPMLLPQVTVTKGCYSLLMRYAIDAPSDKQMDSFQDLTNRFTVFITQKRIITVHRTQCSYVEELKLNWQQHLTGEGLDGTRNAYRDASGLFLAESDGPPTPRGLRYLLYYFVKETVGTFTIAISKCIVEFDKYEANLFNTQRNRSFMARDIYHIKRRASVYGRTLTLTQDAYAHIASALHISTSQVGYQEIMHDLAHVESLAEELNSNADSVLQLLFQLSSYQVNELMRVLTLFSAFFIPLSFIASVYGMNFEDLPMLHSPYGGVFCGALMCTVASCIFMWFRMNRFI